MGNKPETTSKRWKVDRDDLNDPKAKWVTKEGWRSEPPGEEPSIAQIGKWIEDMVDWSEMMHDTVIELRDRVSAIEGRGPEIELLRQNIRELDYVVQNLNPPSGPRPAGAKVPPERGAK